MTTNQWKELEEEEAEQEAFEDSDDAADDLTDSDDSEWSIQFQSIIHFSNKVYPPTS